MSHVFLKMGSERGEIGVRSVRMTGEYAVPNGVFRPASDLRSPL